MSLSISLPSSIKDESTIILLQDLTTLLLDNLNSPIYHLSLDQQNCIKIFIQNSPEIFKKITTGINDIFKDGKIDLYDIPFIIQLLVDTYQLYNINNTSLNSDNVFVFIQYTIDVIIDSKFVVLPNYEKKIVETVVNSSIQLLKTNIVPNTKKCYSFNFCWK
jgi:hypothetical protein